MTRRESGGPYIPTMFPEYSEVLSIADALGLRARGVAAVADLGGGVRVVAEVDAEEAARRAREGPTQPLDWRHLEALSALPHGEAVAWGDIDFDTRIVLDTLPPGTVSSDAWCVRRRWRPTVRPLAVTATAGASSWRAALDRVGCYAAASPRVLVVDDAAAASLARAAHLGVAVVRSGAPCDVLVPLPARTHVRPGPVQWELAEQTWAALRTLGQAIDTQPASAEPRIGTPVRDSS